LTNEHVFHDNLLVLFKTTITIIILTIICTFYDFEKHASFFIPSIAFILLSIFPSHSLSSFFGYGTIVSVLIIFVLFFELNVYDDIHIFNIQQQFNPFVM
jgi:hypothetical protein